MLTSTLNATIRLTASLLLLSAFPSAGAAQSFGSSLADTARGENSTLRITSVLASTPAGITTAMRTVLRSSAEFERYWQEVPAVHGSQAPPMPDIDFSREMVIVASLGFQRGAGAQVAITKVRDWKGVLDVNVQVTLPPTGCDGWPKIEYPMTIVRVPISQSTALFHDRLIKTSC